MNYEFKHELNGGKGNGSVLNKCVTLLNEVMMNKVMQFEMNFINRLKEIVSYCFSREEESEFNDLEAIFEYNSCMFMIQTISRVMEVNRRECLLHFYRKILIYDRFLIIKGNKTDQYIYRHLVLKNTCLSLFEFHYFKSFILKAYIQRWYFIMRTSSLRKTDQSLIIISKVFNTTIERNYLLNQKKIIVRGLISKVIHHEYIILLNIITGAHNLYKLLTKAKITKSHKEVFMSLFLASFITISNQDNNALIMNTVILKYMLHTYQINKSLNKAYCQWMKIAIYLKKIQLKQNKIISQTNNIKAKSYYITSILNMQRLKRLKKAVTMLKLYKTVKSLNLHSNLEIIYNKRLLNVLSALHKSVNIEYKRKKYVRISCISKATTSHLLLTLFGHIFYKWKYMCFYISKEINRRLVYHMLIRAIHKEFILFIIKPKRLFIHKIKLLNSYDKFFYAKKCFALYYINNYFQVKHYKIHFLFWIKFIDYCCLKKRREKAFMKRNKQQPLTSHTKLKKHSVIFQSRLAIRTHKIYLAINSIIKGFYFRTFILSMFDVIKNNNCKRSLILFRCCLIRTNFEKRKTFYHWLNYVFSIKINLIKELTVILEQNKEIQCKAINCIELIEVFKQTIQIINANTSHCKQCIKMAPYNNNFISNIKETKQIKSISTYKVNDEYEEDEDEIEPIPCENAMTHYNNSNSNNQANIGNCQYKNKGSNDYNYDDSNDDTNKEYYSYLEEKEKEIKDKLISLNTLYEPKIELIQNEIDCLYEEINDYIDSNTN